MAYTRLGKGAGFAACVLLASACSAEGGDEPVGAVRLALDSDGDGIDDADDNCDEAPNRFQINCNLDSEEDESVAPAGDACDPEPCPRSRVSTTESAGTVYHALTSLNRMYATTPQTSTGGDASAVEGWTGARFCDCAAAGSSYPNDSPDTRVTCADAMGADCGLNATIPYDNLSGEWGLPTLDYSEADGSSVPSSDLNDRVGDSDEEEVLLDYGDTGRSTLRHLVNVTWDYEADEGDFNYTINAADEFEYDSVVWTHVHDDTRNSVSIDDKLTSHYWSGTQGRTIEDGTRSIPDPCGEFLPYLIPPSPVCPACSHARGAWSYIEPLCATQDPFVEIWFPNMVLDGDSFYEWSTPEELADVDGSWVHASDPNGWREHGTLHAALADDGSEVYTVLSASEGNGYSHSDVNTSGPSARDDFGAVLSQRRDTLYVIGGVDLQGTPTMELWRYDVGSDSWSSETISNQGFGPVRVLAAAYSPAEDALVVLDRPAQGTDVRLWRMPLPFSTEGSEWVSSWQSQGTYSDFGLAATSEAPFYNVLCDRGSNGHAVLRLDPGDGSVEEYVTDADELEQTVLLGHEQAVSVLALDGNGAPYPLAHDSFSGAGGSTSDLCFQ